MLAYQATALSSYINAINVAVPKYKRLSSREMCDIISNNMQLIFQK